jgi:hypothetical protein
VGRFFIEDGEMNTQRLNKFSAMGGIKHVNDNKKLGKMRRLDASDEHSLDHPSHKEQWFEVARAIGRQIARDERDGCSGQHIGG